MRSATYLILALLLLSSCEKFLEEKPETQYTTDNFFVDKTTLDAGIVGMYSSAKDLFGVYTNTPLFMTELGTDEAMFKGTSGVRFNFDRYTFSVSEGSVYEYWIRHYEIAARANTIIAAAAKVQTITEADRNEITGEARFIRAFVYFRLVQAFGEVPMIEQPITGKFDYGLPRRPIKDVYDFILADLEFAAKENILTRNKTNNGHANQWAAKTLLGKVYLTMASAKEAGKVPGYQDLASDLYTKAWEVLKDVKDNSGADLLPVYGDVFKIENKNVNIESLFELQFSSVVPYGTQWTKEYGMPYTGGTVNGNPLYYTNSMAGVTNLVYVPKFYTYYKKALKDPDYDKRRVWNLTDSMINVANNAPSKLTYNWTSPYTPDSYNQTIMGRCGVTKYRWGNSWNTTSQYLYSNCPNNVIVLRFADVLLMFAEADYKKNGVISAEGLSAINRVRQRARGLNANGTPVTEATTPTFKNYTAANITIDEILMERARELCFEFQRWFDLARTGKFETFLALTRSPTDTKIVNTSTSFDPEKNYLFPIPQSELDLSTNKANFKQNPNY
ncbi:RagB/SusD family nutrient uptake outer membrane protein [Chitinophaga sp. SYP-B3965]|uniref:RagB/SusD family nutrient uptake outer membrane protein n=1 Tax=Chitinophaga sp. SYP-B3965 TaxID=2663120 RepID=UPI001299B532|nr:RagB/SusD family nutrient uptake outer membrane protein [Chitinophaga sp. SYP-B3965]MRG44820.1 RagB/SusD family nutrient uptake outer membrane protein [Chitinophaga sp. SYP-B3965]